MPSEQFPETGNGNAAPESAGGESRESYYYADGKQIPVNRRDDLVAVRFSPRASSESVRAWSDARMVGLEPVEEFPQFQDSSLRIFRAADVRTAGIRDLAESAEAQPEVDKVGEVFTNRSNQPLILTDQLVSRFRPEMTADQIERVKESYGLETVEDLGFVENGFVLRVRSEAGMSALEVANSLVEQGHAVYASPNFIEHIPVRSVAAVAEDTEAAEGAEVRHAVTDPRFPDQWHLENTGQGGGTPGADVRAHGAWHMTLGHPDVRIAIVDNEVDIRHEDLNVPGKIVAPRDFDVSPPDADPSPTPGSGLHGTSCAGVATAAQNNARGVTGVAPGCRLIPIRAASDSVGTQLGLARAIQYAADNQASIISCSLGPDGVPWIRQDVLRDAFDYATTYGRGGRGCVIFWAGGNGNESISTDQVASYERIIAVGASNWRDRRSQYSDFGPELDIVAPSNDRVAGALGVTTTLGTPGAPPGPTSAYTATFGGTSSAAPLAAGVGALVVSVNRNLSWEEVRQVLLDSADKIDAAANPYGPAPADLPPGTRNDRYGYGRVNAERAVTLARSASGRRDLFLRDNAGDTGSVPQPAPFYDSPDIWVRNLDDGGTVHQNTIRGRDNFIHARVRNRGSQASHPCWVRFYISTFATTQFRYPFDFKLDTTSAPAGGTPGNRRPIGAFPTPATYLVGEQRIASVPAGGSIVARVPWRRNLIPPAVGWHPCLLVEVSPHDGPAPTGSHVWENNNLGQKNISIVDAARGALLDFPFRFGHALLEEKLTVLEVRRVRAPRELGLYLDVREPRLLQSILAAVNLPVPPVSPPGVLIGGIGAIVTPAGGMITPQPKRAEGGRALPWRLTFLDEARVAVESGEARSDEAPLVVTFPQGASVEIGRGSAEAISAGGEAVAQEPGGAGEPGDGARGGPAPFSVASLKGTNVLALNPALSSAVMKVPLAKAGVTESSLKLKVPANARPGDSYVIDVVERDSGGRLVGGVRLQVNVR